GRRGGGDSGGGGGGTVGRRLSNAAATAADLLSRTFSFHKDRGSLGSRREASSASSSSALTFPPTTTPSAAAAAGAGPVDDSSPVLPLLHTLQRSVSSRQRLGGPAAAQAGWQAKLLQRQALQGRAYQPQLMFVDPTQFLRNERIFLLWLRTAITVGGIATGMLGFAASAPTDPYQRPTIHISEITSFVLLGVAVAMAAYGLGAFVWRSTRFYELHPTRFDDTTGALAMTAAVTLALFSLLVVNMADLMEVLGGEGTGGGEGGRGGAHAGGYGI
ncbi:hypothetical protein Agub_g6153, partial [Astrephomene gubernaculifera]